MKLSEHYIASCKAQFTTTEQSKELIESWVKYYEKEFANESEDFFIGALEILRLVIVEFDKKLDIIQDSHIAVALSVSMVFRSLGLITVYEERFRSKEELWSR